MQEKNSWFERLKKEFLYGGHLFALGSAGVIMSTALVGGFKIDPMFLILIYFIYYLIYLYDHSSGADADAITNPVRAAYLKGRIRQERYSFAISFFVVAMILVYKDNIFISVASALTLFLGMLYGKVFKNITKKIVAFKNFFVAAFWGIIVIYATFCHGAALSGAIWAFSAYVFIRMLAIQAFFDVRDVEGDRLKSLKTFPAEYGVNNTIKLIYGLSFLSALITLWAVYSGYWYPALLLLVLPLAYSVFYIKKCINGDSACYLWAAVEFLLWTSLVLISNILEWHKCFRIFCYK